jgi:hypothetical protein
MSKTYIPESVRQRVAEAARYRCGYCQTLQDIVGYPLHVEHIIPEAADGSSALESSLLHSPDSFFKTPRPSHSAGCDKWRCST